MTTSTERAGLKRVSSPLNEHHACVLAQEAEAQIDAARMALWAARTLIELLKKEARDEKQAELVDLVLRSVDDSLSHLTEDGPSGCLGAIGAGVTGDLIGAMVVAFDPQHVPEWIDAVLARKHWRDGDDDDEEGAP